jgi:prolyl oligopeptidase
MRIFTTPFLLLYLMIGNADTIRSQQTIVYPKTKKETVRDVYHGTQVNDDYRWLEDDRSSLTALWVTEQNKVTEGFLSQTGMQPKIQERLTKLWNYNRQSVPFKKGNTYYCFRNTGLQNQSVMFMSQKENAAEKDWQLLLDPNKLSADGTVSLNGTSISHSGKTMAYSVSKAGSDWQEIRFMDMATKKELKDMLSWVKFSSMAWHGNGIYYSRYDEPKVSALTQKNTGHKIFYHQIGTPQSQDRLIYKDDSHPEYNFSAQVTDDERFLILYISLSTSGQRVMIKDLSLKNSSFESLSDNFNSDYSVFDNTGDTLYMRTNEQAPNYKVETFRMVNGKITGRKILINASESLLEGARLSNGKLLINYLKDASSRLYVFSNEGVQMTEIKLPGICRLTGLNVDKKSDYAAYGIAQFIAPEQVYKLNTRDFSSSLIFKPDIDFRSEDYVTKQVFYKSKDGTEIPMFITHRTDVEPNPETPCFVYGYGGFNISLGPEFRIDRALFLEAGGIYCVPILRGGGEYGESWHKAGTKCSKQNVFDDFISACEYLVKSNMTSNRKIAIHGRSNGGLLIGAVMTQRPEICKVALPTVGVLDMLRFHLFTIGRAWTVDYGCSENKDEFECLYQYSPYHQLKEGAYPSTLVLTGDHDDRVVPAHSFKFAARLQEKQKGTDPVLIRIDINAGHGAGKPTSKQISEFTDMWSFTFHQLGMSF